ncbi:suppressor of G2 allele of skp1 isoform X2 [Oratosquilla oratoria]|uniref:suppressor of G2 allele of skp1 isoform X2 n=1 Tax=Oratosquilla oratoria TaxID=337810 RepID=UPI003F770871
MKSEIDKLIGEGSYLRAVEIITSHLSEKPEDPELFILRARILLKLERFKEAANDSAKAVSLNGGSEAYLALGKALFNLGCFSQAKEAFTCGLKSSGEKAGLNQFSQWADWCDGRIQKVGPGETLHLQEPLRSIDCLKNIQEVKNSGSDSAVLSLSQTAIPKTKMDQEKDASSKANTSVDNTAMPTPKIKHDWYQTDSQVVITILIKHMAKEDVKVDFTDKTVSVTAKLPSGSDYSLELDLCHPIIPSNSSFRVVPSKIEVKMKKADGIRWNSLEGDGAAPSVKSINEGAAKENIPSYPTSSSKKVDWDKIEADVEKEEAEEKLEGDAAINQLFQKLYSESSDEVKRAMNKSFMESGGTVLSTNWNEVGKDKVDIKPPDGMEWKKWSQ